VHSTGADAGEGVSIVHARPGSLRDASRTKANPAGSAFVIGLVAIEIQPFNLALLV
jgi:hypothetical protein